MGDLKPSSSHYSNFGGVNQKSSAYSTQNSQCLDLRNLDFFVPNAWAKTPGSTQAIAFGTSGPILGLFEFERLTGESYLLVGTNTALFKNEPGSTLTVVSTGWTNNQPYDFQAFLNKAWIANGQKCESFNGTSTFVFGLPANYAKPAWSPGSAALSNISVMGVTQPTAAADMFNSGVKALLYVGYSYVRSDGYIGPMTVANIASASPANLLFPGGTDWQGTTTGNFGGNVTLTISGLTTPSGFGVTAIAIYLAMDHFTNSPRFSSNNNVLTTGWFYNTAVTPGNNFYFFTLVAAGTTLLRISGVDSWTSFIGQTTSVQFSHMIFDFFATYTPKYLEVFQNRLAISGFSNAPSLSYLSKVGLPENFAENSFFEARTNDGDRILGTKVYQNQWIIFKKNSFHKLIGNSEENFELVQISAEYGALSNQAIVEVNDKLLFLDEQGIVEYNGANWQIISIPVEPVFRRMNVSSAIEKAVGIHYQERNQVWFGIPVDGATENNLTVVYDYVLNAWTFIEGFRPSAVTSAKQYLNKSTTWYGTPSGVVYYMSPSFLSYNGVGYTSYVQTSFDAPDGKDVESMFRRLFLDVNTVSGVTGVINVEVFSNYNQNTVQATFAVYQNQFQTRSDFGVMAKSIGFKMYHSNVSLPLVINGYDVQRRFLRKV